MIEASRREPLEFLRQATTVKSREEEKIEDSHVLIKKLKEWSMKTTAHGLPKIIESDNWFLKIMWIIFTLAAIGFCAFMLAKAIIQYLKFEITTQITEINQEEIVFPMISICNVNPMITVKANEYITKYYLDTFKRTVSTYSELVDVEYELGIYERPWLIYQTYDKNFDMDLRKSFGYPAYDFLSYSEFGNNYFYDSNRPLYEWFYHPLYGNCYRFNSGRNSTGSPMDLFKMSQIGQGYSAEIFTGLSERKYDFLSQLIYTGAVLIISDQDNAPIRSHGILIKPGVYAKIDLKKVVNIALPSPYTDCIEADNVDTLIANEMKKLSIKYTRRNCMTLCEQKQIIDKLGCYDMSLPAILNALPCSTRSQFEQILLIKFNYSICFDLCPFECTSTSFEYSISYADYPSWNNYHYTYWYWKSYYNNLFKTTYMSFDMFKESVARIYVSYEELKYTEISQSESMQLVDLIANLGGTLGLFIGVSVLSFVELLEVIIHFFVSVSNDLKPKKVVSSIA